MLATAATADAAGATADAAGAIAARARSHLLPPPFAANDRLPPADNHSIPPALSNMLDHFGCSMYSYKPSAICTYSPGPWGGRHCAMALLPLLTELGCLPVSNVFSAADARNTITADGECEDRVLARFGKMAVQLEWHAHAMRRQRQMFGVPK